MAVTKEDVVRIIESDEPDYGRAARLGAEALPHLEVLAEGRDVGTAAKAVYAASVIGGHKAAAIVEKAAMHPEAIMRIAAASALRNLGAEDAARIAARTLRDSDFSVRKVSLQSAGASRAAALRQAVEEQLKIEKEPFLRNLAEETLKRIAGRLGAE